MLTPTAQSLADRGIFGIHDSKGNWDFHVQNYPESHSYGATVNLTAKTMVDGAYCTFTMNLPIAAAWKLADMVNELRAKVDS